ncbi:MAG: polysaccharide deacetylase family protein [Candidatus Eremiobacteraeota bacterium]|nr:polysaccharide deacetylase family protein [Candidatus Eremiobacteraeota bacterium]
MTIRVRWIVTLVVAGLFALVAWRLFVHTGALAKPALIVPSMNAHEALSPDLGARVDRLLNERKEANRTDRPKLIALTFDDGPYPVFTPLLLAELRALHVPATFFLIGRDAEQWPELTRRIRADGNEIADHTYSHPDLDEETDAQVRAEILKGRDTVWAIAPDPSLRTLMRPPHGRFNEGTIAVAQSLGYQVVLWTDDSGDWRTLTADEIRHHLLAHATSPEIVLLHSGKLATIEALPEVVARFRAAGYRFVTAGDLIRQVPAESINHPAKGPV